MHEDLIVAAKFKLMGADEFDYLHVRDSIHSYPLIGRKRLGLCSKVLLFLSVRLRLESW